MSEKVRCVVEEREGDHLEKHVQAHTCPTRGSSDLLNALRADEVAEVADRDIVDVGRYVPGNGQQPRHRHPPAPQEREPDAPVGEIGEADEGAGCDAKQFVDHEVGALSGLQRRRQDRSEEHTSELQSLMRLSYAVFCLKKHTKLE